MTVKFEHSDGVDVLSPSGRLDSTSAPKLEAEIKKHAENSSAPLLVDLGGVDYISSAGLRTLLLGVKAFAGTQRRFIVAAASPDVRDVILLTGFDKVLTLANSVDEGRAEALR